MNKFKLLLLALGIMIFSQSLRATLPSDSIQNKEIKIKEVTVVGDLSKMLALPMVVVNSATMQTGSFVTPADVLQRETGISIARDGIWSTSINIRGFSEQRILEMVDGDRIQTATEHSGPLSTIDMNSIDKIEVIKGASSVLYGTGAMGGVINFVSERPTYTPNFLSNGKIGTEFNTVNKLWTNNANLNFTTNQWYIALNGTYRTANNTQTPCGVLPNSQFHDASWALKAGIKYAANEEFLVNYQHFGAWNVGIPGGRSFPATAIARYTRVERNQLSGEYIISKINENLNEIRLKAYTQEINRDVELKPNGTTTMFPSSLNKTSGAKITSDWRFTDYHSLIFGAEGWVRDATTARLTLKTLSDTTTTGTGDQPTPKAQMIDLGVFAHYSWKIVPPKLTLNAGLRLDYIQTSNDTSFNQLYQYTINKGVRTDVKNFSRTVYFPASSKNDIAYAAHIDMVFNPTNKQQIALSLSNSYRVASIEERFKYIFLGGAKYFGNPDLKPENGTFTNLNYTLFDKKFKLKIDVFANYLNNLISDILTAPLVYTTKNISKALFLGAELESKWQITDQFSLLANASYTRARDIDAKTFLPQIPPLHGFASFNYQSKNQIGASFSALWAATQNQIFPGETATAGHIIYNLNVHSGNILLNKSQLQLFAGVDNILNKAYLDHLSTTRGILKLEPGRNIYLKAKLGW